VGYRKQIIAAAIAAAAAASSAVAAPTATADARALLLLPLQLTKVNDLDFGTVVKSNGSGTIALNANTGARSFAGGVTGVTTSGGHRALFGGAGTGGQQVVVLVIPPSQLKNSNGDTIDVLALTIDNNGNPLRTIDPVTRSFFVNVGGILSIGANQPDGIYSATFQVTANYF
jgi:opacity protein-like surface antigen